MCRVILLLSSLALLLIVVVRPRFGTRLRACALIAAMAAGLVYWQQKSEAEAAAHVHRRPLCEFPKQATNEPRKCYDPHNRAEFIRHLEECKIVPGAPPGSGDIPSKDSRNVPCDYFDQRLNKEAAQAMQAASQTATPALPPGHTSQ
jgi:hypothetical protein